MEQLLLIPAFSILNALRGRDLISRMLCAFLMGVATGLATFNYIFGVIAFLGMWFGLVWGWGKYFAVFTGNMEDIKESEVLTIDWILNKILGVPENVRQLKIWSFFAFTLRGAIFYPTFIALAYFHHNALFYGIGVLSMGVVYGMMNFVPIRYAVQIAEPIFGAILGGLVAISVM